MTVDERRQLGTFSVADGQHRECGDKRSGLVAQISELISRRAPFDDTMPAADFERAVLDQMRDNPVLPPIMTKPSVYTVPRATSLHHS